MCAEGVSDEYDPKELVCGACSNVAAAQVSGKRKCERSKRGSEGVRGVRVGSKGRESRE